MKFNELEKKLLLEFLDELDDHYGNMSCNDFSLPNTPEGRELHEASIRYGMSKEEADEWLAEKPKGKKISTFDSTVLGYLRHKLEIMLKD